jgi:hypothetical protein
MIEALSQNPARTFSSVFFMPGCCGYCALIGGLLKRNRPTDDKVIKKNLRFD